MAMTTFPVYKILILGVILGLVDGIRKERERCPTVAQISQHFVSTLDDMCYMFVGHEKYWNEARDYCWELGGELITIESKKTLDHIKKYLRSRRVRWSSNGIWIGAEYFKNERQWKWTTGEHVVFDNWVPGQGGEIFGKSFENCAIMRRSDDWKWHDKPCHFASFTYRFICQFRREAEPVDAPALYITNSEAIAGSKTGGQNEKYTLTDSTDNGNTLILCIIIGASLGVILILILIFFIFRYYQKKKYLQEVPSTHYGNEHYAEIDSRSEYSLQFHNRPRLPNDIYLTPVEVSRLNEDANKPANSNGNLSHITCPLLLTESNDNRQNERQVAEGSSTEPIATTEATEPPPEVPQTPAVASQSGAGVIPSIMETSTRSVNEYVEMSSGAVMAPPSVCKPNAGNEQKLPDANSYTKPVKTLDEYPVYGNVNSAQNSQSSADTNPIYEDLP